MLVLSRYARIRYTHPVAVPRKPRFHEGRGRFYASGSTRAFREYRQEIGGKMDIVLLDSLYQEIAGYCGEEPLEVFNKSIAKQYVAVDFADLLLQVFYSNAFYTFTDRDDESGREYFFLLLDEAKTA